MRRDDPWSWSWEILFKTLYRKSVYHWPVIGDMKILKEVPQERLLKYYKTHYVPTNTVIAIVGNVKAPQIAQWINKNYENHKAAKVPTRTITQEPEQKGLRLHLEAGEVQQIYCSLGFPSVPLNHPDAALWKFCRSFRRWGSEPI